MDVGLFAMPLHPPGSNVTETLENDLDMLITLEKMGYSEAWIGEHFTTQWENIPAPDIFIAHALAKTERMKFGTGVTCMPNHNPFMIAHRIAQLDHMAKGRFMWGVGSGGFPGDFEVFGFDPKTGEHRAMTREAIETVLMLWNDPKPGRYRTAFWDFNIPEPDDLIGLRVHMEPYQKPHPPIGVAGVSENSGTLTLAGARGWIPMSINLVPTRVIKTHWESVEEGAREAGRTPDRSQWRIAREVYIAETTEKARKEALEGTLARDFRHYFLHIMPKVRMLDAMKIDTDMADSDVTVEYLVDNVFIVGSPDDVTAKLQKLYDDVGGFGVLLAMAHEWQPRDQWVNSMSLLANEVIPRLNNGAA
jgi:alkanesulfonate monooxygenase SsuD/methylene tetrahydromethanopterin reductase-like flavin-dependent oxidoreductase (luciferase family)